MISSMGKNRITRIRLPCPFPKVLGGIYECLKDVYVKGTEKSGAARNPVFS
jgi:hypothetical protein